MTIDISSTIPNFSKILFMQLVLSVAGKELDRIKLSKEFYKDEDYLSAQKRLLLTKHELSIIALQEKPSFYIEAISKINPDNYKTL
jgi:hypothetical protein